MNLVLRSLFSEAVDAPLNEKDRDLEAIKIHPFAWSFGQLRCLTTDLGELGDTSLPICAVASDDTLTWDEARTRDATELNRFAEDRSGHAEVRCYSVAITDLSRAEIHFDELRGFSGADIEVLLPARLEGAEDVIALASEREYLQLAFPVFPGVAESVAFSIVECLGLEVPYKLLGLKGNLFSDAHSVGLINAMAASALGYAEDLGPETIVKILRAPNTDGWKIDSDGIGYEDLFANIQEIQEARTIALGLEAKDWEIAFSEIQSAIS